MALLRIYLLRVVYLFCVLARFFFVPFRVGRRALEPVLVVALD